MSLHLHWSSSQSFVYVICKVVHAYFKKIKEMCDLECENP